MYLIPVEHTDNDIGTTRSCVARNMVYFVAFTLGSFAVRLLDQELRIGRQLAAVGFEYLPFFPLKNTSAV